MSLLLTEKSSWGKHSDPLPIYNQIFCFCVLLLSHELFIYFDVRFAGVFSWPAGRHFMSFGVSFAPQKLNSLTYRTVYICFCCRHFGAGSAKPSASVASTEGGRRGHSPSCWRPARRASRAPAARHTAGRAQRARQSGDQRPGARTSSGDLRAESRLRSWPGAPLVQSVPAALTRRP